MKQIIKTEIEKAGTIDKVTAKRISLLVINKGLPEAKLFCSIYHPELLIGKGGSHIWFKRRDDINNRIAITYLNN